MIKTPVISSPANPLVKDVRRAIARGELTSEGLLIAETYHLLDEAIRSRLEIPVVLAAVHARREVEARLNGHPGTRLVVLPDTLFAKLVGTQTAQGLIALIKPPKWSLEDLFTVLPLIVVIDGVQDPGNAGSIVRAAEAFGASGVVFLKGSVNPLNPKAIRASAGSLFRVPFQSGVAAESATAACRERGVRLYSTGPRAPTSILDVNFNTPISIVIGSEGRGVTEATAKRSEHVYIPTAIVESLNAAQAAAVILYEAARQRSGR